MTIRPLSGNVVQLAKTIKSALGVRLSIVGIVVATILARLEWIQRKLVELEWIPPEGANMIFGAPGWAWAASFFFLYFGFFFLRYAHKLRMQIQEGRKDIAQLRARGVEIRNKGLGPFNTHIEFSTWTQEVMQWKRETEKALKKISEADSIWFSVLDDVPMDIRVYSIVSFGVAGYQFQQDHLKLLREHDKRLGNLGKMIRELWGFKDVNG